MGKIFFGDLSFSSPFPGFIFENGRLQLFPSGRKSCVCPASFLSVFAGIFRGSLCSFGKKIPLPALQETMVKCRVRINRIFRSMSWKVYFGTLYFRKYIL